MGKARKTQKAKSLVNFKYANYNAAELIFGKELAKVFKQFLHTGMLSDIVTRIPNNDEKKSFYDGLVAGLLFSCVAIKTIKQCIDSINNTNNTDNTEQSIKEIFSAFAFILLALSEYTNSSGLDLLFKEEIDVLFNQTPNRIVDYSAAAVQSVRQTLNEMGWVKPSLRCLTKKRKS